VENWKKFKALLREKVSFYDKVVIFAPDLEAAKPYD